MTENSKIEWCDATWQVTHGCKKVAAGCANCYAIRDAHRMAGHPNPKISGPRQGLTKWVHRSPNERAFVDWTGVVRTAPENLAIPLRWKKPKRIFVNSNSDLFHEAVPFEFIAAVYGVMAACPQHRFIILTKRPKRMREFFEWCDGGKRVAEAAAKQWRHLDAENAKPAVTWNLHAASINLLLGNEKSSWPHWPLLNVIHGYSAANQPDLDAGIADLLATPSALRCLSLEPLIGPVDLRPWLECRCDKNGNCDVCLTGGIDWVLVGGESGPGARPCDIEWIRSIVEQCKAAGALCFVKQLGSRPVADFYDDEARELYDDALEPFPDPDDWDIDMNGQPPVDSPVSLKIIKDRKGADPSEWPADLRVRQWPEVQG